MSETWVPAVVCGIALAVAQFAASNHLSAQLADIAAVLAGAGALVAVPQARRPAAEPVRASVLTGVRSEELDEQDPRAEVVRAYAPYALIVAVFSVAQLPAVKDWPAGRLRGTTGPSWTSSARTGSGSAATCSPGRSCPPAARSCCSRGWARRS